MRITHLSQSGSIGRNAAIGLAVVLVLICGVLFLTTHKKAANTAKQQASEASSNASGYLTTADDFVRAMTSKDGKTSYNLMTAKAQSQAGSESKWQSTISSSYDKSTGNPQRTSDSTLDTFNGSYNNQSPHQVVYTSKLFNTNWQTILIVVQSGSSWKIDNITSQPVSS